MTISEKDHIIVKGAKVHNLKNIDVAIPRNKLVVITGLSGSGKSSLAFDTIYAEGQRRYVESLSSYARQFLGRINKPEVDYILGIPPAIAIEQKVNTRNPRSTVGTSTEIYDYLKLLYARIGKTFSPISNQEVKKHSVTDVIDYIFSQGEEQRVMIMFPFPWLHVKNLNEYLEFIAKEGYVRLEVNGIPQKMSDIATKVDISKKDEVFVIVDRMLCKDNEDTRSRLGDSISTAFNEGDGICHIRMIETNNHEIFSQRFEADGITFEEPSEYMFSFNNPIGACPKCEGYGKVVGIDEDLVIPDKSLSIYDEAIVCWRGEKMKTWSQKLIYSADKFDFPIHKPYYDLSSEQKELLWTGNKYFNGLNDFFAHLEEKKYKIQYRVMLSRYRGKTTCPECKGTRLKKEATYVKVDNKAITDLVDLSIERLYDFISTLKLSKHDEKIAGRLLKEIQSRVDFLLNVGLSYLSLNRLSATLSGGESQRINLATSLGSSLVGSLYILDEPSIGLHSKDTERLIQVLTELTALGNTVVVVEHDEDIIRNAEEIIDIGPASGLHGGEVVFQGDKEALLQAKDSLTAAYLTGKEKIELPSSRRRWNNYIEVNGARENNLKNFSVKFPLNLMTVVTGVSGSGKSSLVGQILFPALNKIFNGFGEKTGEHDSITGDIKMLTNVEFVNQNPIGKSSRSNPVTYLKAYDEIRKLFSQQQSAAINNLKPAHFSFNVDGGRCEECQGEGTIKVEMQFMADIELVCESCQGKRFKEEVLDVKYKGKNIHDILEMSVTESIAFFSEENKSTEKKIVEKIQPLEDVGLGYIKLGQSSSTLSGGESQRVKLASFLSKEVGRDKLMFIFDEPTTGLHFHDIKVLLKAFNALINKGHTIIIIEHNLDVIKSADWIIDLGPEGGVNGGNVVFEGIPEDCVKEKKSVTGQFLQLN